MQRCIPFLLALLLSFPPLSRSAAGDVKYLCGQSAPATNICGDASTCSGAGICLGDPTDLVYIGWKSLLYITDRTADHVRAIDTSTFLVSTALGPSGSTSSGDTIDNTNPANHRFKDPLGITYSGSTLYITDSSNSKIKSYSTVMSTLALYAGTGSNMFLANVAVANSRFDTPGAICAYNWKLYVINTGTNQMHRIHESFGFTSALTFFNSGNSITVFRGTGYATVTNRHIVYSLNLVSSITNTFLGSTAGDALSPPQFNNAGAIRATCGRNILYISDDTNAKLKQYSFKTTVTSLLVGTGTAPTGAAVDSTGTSFAIGKVLGMTWVTTQYMYMIDPSMDWVLRYEGASSGSKYCAYTSTRSPSESPKSKSVFSKTQKELKTRSKTFSHSKSRSRELSDTIRTYTKQGRTPSRTHTLTKRTKSREFTKKSVSRTLQKTKSYTHSGTSTNTRQVRKNTRTSTPSLTHSISRDQRTWDVRYVCGRTAASAANVCGDGSPCSVYTCFVEPLEVVYVPFRNSFYVIDTGAHHIRSIDLSTSLVKVFMGSVLVSQSGDIIDNSNLFNVRFKAPTAMCLANSVTLYIADTGNSKIKVFDFLRFELSLLAGTGAKHFVADVDFNTVSFELPTGMAYYNKRLYVLNADITTMHVLHTNYRYATALGISAALGVSITIYRGIGYVSVQQPAITKINIATGALVVLFNSVGDSITPLRFTTTTATMVHCGRKTLYIADSGTGKVKSYDLVTQQGKLIAGSGRKTPHQMGIAENWNYRLNNVRGLTMVASTDLYMMDQFFGSLYNLKIPSGSTTIFCDYTRTKSYSRTYQFDSKTGNSRSRSPLDPTADIRTHTLLTDTEHDHSLSKSLTDSKILEAQFSNDPTSSSTESWHIHTNTRTHTHTKSRTQAQPSLTFSFTRDKYVTRTVTHSLSQQKLKTPTDTIGERSYTLTKLSKTGEIPESSTQSHTHSFTKDHTGSDTPERESPTLTKIITDYLEVSGDVNTPTYKTSSRSYQRRTPTSLTVDNLKSRSVSSTYDTGKTMTNTETYRLTLTITRSMTIEVRSLSVTRTASFLKHSVSGTHSDTLNRFTPTDSMERTKQTTVVSRSLDITPIYTDSISHSLDPSETATNSDSNSLDSSASKTDSRTVSKKKVSLDVTADPSSTKSRTRTPWPFPPMNISYLGMNEPVEGDNRTFYRITADSLRESGLDILLRIEVSVFVWQTKVTWEGKHPLVTFRYMNTTDGYARSPNGFFNALESQGAGFLVIERLNLLEVKVHISPLLMYKPKVPEKIEIVFSRYAFVPRAEEDWTMYLDVTQMDYSVISPEMRTAVETASLVASGSSAFAASPAVASQAGRLSLLMEATECPRESFAHLDYISHPTQLTIGDEINVKVYLGSLVFNFVIIVCFFVCHVIVVIVHYMHSSGVQQSSWQKSMNELHFPSYSFSTVMFFYQSMVRSSLYILMHSDAASAQFAGVFFFVLSLVFLGFFWWKTTGPRFNAAWLPEDAVTMQIAYDDSPFLNWLHEVTSCGGSWIEVKPGSPFVHRYNFMFVSLREGRQWFMGVDVFILFWFGVTGAQEPTTDTGCMIVAVFEMLFFLLYFLLVVLLNPFSRKIDKAFYIVATFIQFIASIFVLVLKAENDRVPSAVFMVPACIYVIIGFLCFKALVDWGVHMIDHHHRLRSHLFPSHGKFDVVLTGVDGGETPWSNIELEMTQNLLHKNPNPSSGHASIPSTPQHQNVIPHSIPAETSNNVFYDDYAPPIPRPAVPRMPSHSYATETPDVIFYPMENDGSVTHRNMTAFRPLQNMSAFLPKPKMSRPSNTFS